MSVTNPITIGHAEAREKLTARLFWKLRTESGYNDAGNVKDYVDASTRTLVTRTRSANGARYVNDEQVDVSHESYTFLLDERDANQERLILLSLEATEDAQAAVEGATATISNVKNGKWFLIGAVNIANVSVSGSLAGPCDEGTDYELDKENGRIRVIPGASIADGETLTVTFDQPGIHFQVFESQKNPLFYCDFVIEEYNQYSSVWLRKRAFSGYLNVTEFPSQTGEFGTYRVKVTPSGPVTVTKRPEAQTLPTHGETGAAANSSSSSSNSSTSSGGSSSSSSS